MRSTVIFWKALKPNKIGAIAQLQQAITTRVNKNLSSDQPENKFSHLIIKVCLNGLNFLAKK